MVVALMPGRLKILSYRWLFGYRIGHGVRIGVTIIDAGECDIGDDAVIGHGNVVTSVKELIIGDHTRIGHLNLIRGGNQVDIGRYAQIIRLNEINSIVDPEVVNQVDPRFTLGVGSVITAGHKIDFTDRVAIGRNTIIAGRHSSLWTHYRQRTLPVTIGDHTYVGSEIRMAPGAILPSHAVVGIGAVVVDSLEGHDGELIAGVPARALRPLTDADRFITEGKTRSDLPDDL